MQDRNSVSPRNGIIYWRHNSEFYVWNACIHIRVYICMYVNCHAHISSFNLHFFNLILISCTNPQIGLLCMYMFLVSFGEHTGFLVHSSCLYWVMSGSVRFKKILIWCWPECLLLSQVKACRATREVTATYQMEEVNIELQILLPENYPLGKIAVSSQRRVGVNQSQWDRWLLQLNVFLQHQVNQAEPIGFTYFYDFGLMSDERN